ncbi:MAG: IS66 family insertion sequence element accessory protein TnpA, partial [Steroidobacteraceae bacterium]
RRRVAMGRRATVRGDVGQRRQWTKEHARETLAELEASGETVASFADRKSVSPQRIAYWKKRLSEPAATDFVAVTLPTRSPGWLELDAGGVTVRVRDDLDVEQVARLVEALARRVGRTC